MASSEPTPLRTLLPDLLGRLGQQAGGLPALTALWARVQGRVIAAHSRPALLAACKALDRVIRSGRYWVPHWYKASHWLAYWDVFGRPKAQPRYARGIPDTWWSNT